MTLRKGPPPILRCLGFPQGKERDRFDMSIKMYSNRKEKKNLDSYTLPHVAVCTASIKSVLRLSDIQIKSSHAAHAAHAHGSSRRGTLS
jgi:hypothetical protein